MRADYRRELTKNCSECGKQFTTTNPQALTCGVSCSRNRKIRGARERMNRQTPKIDHRLNCVECGKVFVVSVRAGGSVTKKFCKKACCAAHNRRHRSKMRKKEAVGIEEFMARFEWQKTEVAPETVASHDPEIQAAIDAYLSKGGKVTRIEPQLRPSWLDEDDYRFDHPDELRPTELWPEMF